MAAQVFNFRGMQFVYVAYGSGNASWSVWEDRTHMLHVIVFTAGMLLQS